MAVGWCEVAVVCKALVLPGGDSVRLGVVAVVAGVCYLISRASWLATMWYLVHFNLFILEKFIILLVFLCNFL